jgi:UDP-glucose 4-epimerase
MLGMTINNKNIFITGGAGFIGSTLASRLSKSNKITLFDNLARNTLQHTSLGESENINLIQGDILNYEDVFKSMNGSDIVVHAAAIAGTDTVIKSPVRTMEVNMIGAANVLRAAQQAGVRDRQFLESVAARTDVKKLVATVNFEVYELPVPSLDTRRCIEIRGGE